ncbi:MAG: hypothetical protein ACEPOV_13530 [Hyphomicrobiales bacterium]
MEVLYKSKTLQNFLEDTQRLSDLYGINAYKIVQRISELRSSDNLNSFKCLPTPKCKVINRSDEMKFTAMVSENIKLIFDSKKKKLTKTENGDIDWDNITSIRILGIRES